MASRVRILTPEAAAAQYVAAPAAVTYSVAKSSGDTPTVAYTSSTFAFLGNGPKVMPTGTHYSNTVGNNTMSAFEWMSDAPQFSIRLNGSKVGGALYVDGALMNLADVATDTSGSNYLVPVDCGPAIKTRRFRWVASVNQSFGGLVLDAAYSAWKPTLNGPYGWWLGDSYTQGTGAAPTTETAAYTAMRELGWQGVTDGWGGAGYPGPETSPDGVQPPSAGGRIRAKLSVLNYAPDYIVFDLLYNNRNTTTLTIITAFDDAVSAARALYPAARLIIMGAAFPMGTAALPGLVDRHNAIRSRAAELGLDFVDTLNYITLGNRARYTGPDNEHPSPAGHIYLGQRKAAAIKAVLKSPAPTPVAPDPASGISDWDHVYRASKLLVNNGDAVSTWPDTGSSPSALAAGTAQVGDIGTTAFVSDSDGGYVRIASTSGNGMAMRTADVQNSPRSVSLLLRGSVGRFAFLGVGGRLGRSGAGGWTFSAIGTGNGGQINQGASADGWAHVLLRSDGAMFVNGVKTTPSSWTPGAATTLRLLASDTADLPTDFREMRSVARVVTDSEAAAIYAAAQANYTSI